MDNTFSDEELLYRAVYPPEFNKMFWKDNNHVSSAAFLDKNGLSVERGNFRRDKEVVDEMKKKFTGRDELCFNLTVPAKVQFYMSQGKPILAMINGDSAELIKEAKCGMAINAGDYNGLAEAVRKMAVMSEPELGTLGDNGKKYYESNFTKEQRMKQLEKLLVN